MNDISFIRLPAVMAETGKGRSTVYANSKAGLLTHPVRVGAGSSAWPKHEIQAINRARLAGADDNQIKSLVSKLHAARKEAA